MYIVDTVTFMVPPVTGTLKQAPFRSFAMSEADETCLPHLPKDISEAAQEVGTHGGNGGDVNVNGNDSGSKNGLVHSYHIFGKILWEYSL